MSEADQHWLCEVIEVDDADGVVHATLRDKTDPSYPVEIAEIYSSAFTHDQWAKLGEGVCFHWRVYVAERRNEFEIIEVPPLSPEEEAAIEREAAELSLALIGDSQ